MTNGLLFDDYWQNEFIAHGHMVNFSLNSSSKENHEKINFHSDFDKVLSNLKSLVRKRNEAKSSLMIAVSFVILSQNIHELASFIELAENLGIDRVRFFFDTANLPSDSKVVEDSLKKAWEKFESRHAKVEGLVCFYRYYCWKKKISNIFKEKADDLESQAPCLAPWNSLYIDHTGQVQSCCMSSIVLGNLNDNSLEELINNRPAITFRKAMSKGNFRYCQPTCAVITNPSYGLTVAKIFNLANKFLTNFKLSPKTAWKKALRKIKQFS